MKRCQVCGEQKLLDDFYRSAGMRDGHRNDCKSCNLAAKKRRYDADPQLEIARVKKWQQANADRLNAYRRVHNATPERKRALRNGYYRRTFGITADDVDAMIEKQGGKCIICGRTPERLASWHVDHCHDTGVVRGILCIDCNQGIGKFHEDPERLRAAADYLESSSR
ncbi:MAG: hypothetical protein QOI95_4044 [Acidimicrobiaceae bacterium]|jgi:hypothetical protein